MIRDLQLTDLQALGETDQRLKPERWLTMRINATLAVMLILLPTIGCAGRYMEEQYEAWNQAYVSWEAQFSSTELASEVVDERAVQAYKSGDYIIRLAIQDAACDTLPASRALPLLFRLGENWLGLAGQLSPLGLVPVNPPPSPMVALIGQTTDEEIFALVQAHPDNDATASAIECIPEDRYDLLRRVLDEPGLADYHPMVTCTFARSTAPAEEIEQRIRELLETRSVASDAFAREPWHQRRGETWINLGLEGDRDHWFVHALSAYRDSHPDVELHYMIRWELERIANSRSRKAAVRLLRGDDKRIRANSRAQK